MLLGYHGLSSSAPRDALCRLRLEINQCLTPPSSNGKARNPPFNKPISLRKAPGYHNINKPQPQVNTFESESAGKGGGLWSPHQTSCHHKTLQAVEEEREHQPLPLWWDFGRGHVSCAVDLAHQSLTIKKHTAGLIRSQRGEGAAALIAVRLQP